MSAGWILLVARELRVQARDRGLSRNRCRCVLAIGALFGWPIVAPRHFLPLAERVHLSFVVVSLAGAGLCLTAGLWQMGSAEEKQHTLELLRQTELDPGQMVVGCFLAKLLRGFYAVLPMLPLLCFPVSAGCASFAEFGRILIGFAVILALSLAVAMLASTLWVDQGGDFSFALLLLLGVTVWFPLGGFYCERVPGLHSCARWLFALSPSITVYRAFNPNGFCEAVLVQFSLTPFVVLMTWARLRLGPLVRYSPWRRRATLPWILPIAPWVLLLALLISLASANRPACEACLLTLYPIHLTLKAMVALQSGLGLRQARCSAALLAELVTTLSTEEILDRRFCEIWRQFRWAVYSLIGVHLAILIMVCGQRRVSLAPEEALSLAIMVLMGAAAICVDTYALIWLGMRHGLEASSVGQAWTRSFGTVIVAPWGIAAAVAMLNRGSFLTANELTGYYLCWLIVGTAVSLKMGTSAKFTLTRDLRRRACETTDSSLL